MGKVICSKEYVDIPFAHRQHEHHGHCSLIHGHNWSFVVHFTADKLDNNGFVVDFGDIRFIKLILNGMFDHALVLNQNDPKLSFLRQTLASEFANITVVPNCGAEGLAKLVHAVVNEELAAEKPWDVAKRGLRCFSVVVKEDSKNSATYTKDPNE